MISWYDKKKDPILDQIVSDYDELKKIREDKPKGIYAPIIEQWKEHCEKERKRILKYLNTNLFDTSPAILTEENLEAARIQMSTPNHNAKFCYKPKEAQCLTES